MKRTLFTHWIDRRLFSTCGNVCEIAVGSVENASSFSRTCSLKLSTRCLMACSWARFTRSTAASTSRQTFILRFAPSLCFFISFIYSIPGVIAVSRVIQFARGKPREGQILERVPESLYTRYLQGCIPFTKRCLCAYLRARHAEQRRNSQNGLERRRNYISADFSKHLSQKRVQPIPPTKQTAIRAASQVERKTPSNHQKIPTDETTTTPLPLPKTLRTLRIVRPPLFKNGLGIPHATCPPPPRQRRRLTQISPRNGRHVERAHQLLFPRHSCASGSRSPSAIRETPL